MPTTEPKSTTTGPEKIIVELKPDILNDTRHSLLLHDTSNPDEQNHSNPEVIEAKTTTTITITTQVAANTSIHNDTLTESDLISKALLDASENMMASSLEYFKHPAQPAQILEDHEIYLRITSMKHLVKNTNFTEYDLFIKHECADSFKNLLQHSYYELVDVDFNKVNLDLENNILKGTTDKLG